MSNRVVVIGGGIAGLAAARTLAELGIETVLLEKEQTTGGHVKNWDRLFPGRRPGKEVIDYLTLTDGPLLEIKYGVNIDGIDRTETGFAIHLDSGGQVVADSIILATGYDLFDATRKEEYGYGIYDNVITSAELEARFRTGTTITTSQGRPPKRVGIIHCVGSRDEKVGHLHCSKVCCITGVKQAIELREMLPDCEVFLFYMDLRMYDRNFEELYFEAQQKWGVNFIRGRLSECSENPDHSLVLKTEDTLSGRPLKMVIDLMVLLIGFVPGKETLRIGGMLGTGKGVDGFLLSADEHIRDNATQVPGVFLAGSVKGPASIVNAIADGKAAATEAFNFIRK